MDKEKTVYILDKITEWSLYILIFCLPFSKTIIELCITVAFFTWVLKKILTRDFRLKKTPLNSLLLAFFIITAISFVNADLKILFLRSLVSKSLKFIVLYFVVVETINSEVKFKNLLTITFISAVVVTVDSYLQHYVTHYDLLRFYPSFKYAPLTDPRRLAFLGYPTGPFPFPNDLSAWMLVIMMPVLFLFIFGIKNGRAKFITGLFLAPFLYLFYLANTRSAWLGFFIGLFLAIFVQSKKIFIGLVIALLLLAIVANFLLTEEKRSDIFGFSSLEDRFYMWRIGWDIFSEHPIIGNGLNMFFHKFKQFREDKDKGLRGSYAHNGFLQMAADIGIIGLVIFLLLIGKAFRSALRNIKKTDNAFHRAFGLGLAGGLLAFLIHSFFDTNLQSLPLVTLFWFSMAVLMSMQNRYGQI